MALGIGAGVIGAGGSLLVIAGAIACAGTRVLGGSKPVNHRSWQYWNHGAISLT